MNKTLYSVNEIAEILGLHPKTVQRFIREGKLKAHKIGRSWKVSIDDLKEYSHAELSVGTEGSTGKGYPVSADKPLEERINVSAVIELKDAADREVSRISNTLIAVLNSKDPAWGKTRYDYIYQPETGTARFILYGKPLFISSIIKMLEPLMDD